MKRGFILLLIALSVFMTIFTIGKFVTATDACCEKSIAGGWCVEDELNNCDPNYQSSLSTCEISGFCSPGYCLESESGSCGLGVAKVFCPAPNIWSNTSLDECTSGCCFLKENTDYMTKGECLVATGSNTFNFSENTPLEKCNFFTTDEGACVTTGGCHWTSEGECLGSGSSTRDFQKGVYCSDENLENDYGYDYTPQAGKECYNGDVYYTDNNGNREGIAQNCGEEEICDENRLSCVSTSCTQVIGSGQNIINLNRDAEGNVQGTIQQGSTVVRKNGESWCEYEGHVGDGKDYVGSEHFKFYCDNGVIRPETNPGSYRDYICAQRVDPISGISEAQLRENLWRECYALDNTAECIDHPDCKIQSINVDTYFKFDVCVPKYPPGFASEKEAEKYCSLASTLDCVKIMDEDGGLRGGDDLVANGNCGTPAYKNQMHNLCTALGDCGSYFNYAGEYSYTDDFQDYVDKLNFCSIVKNLVDTGGCVGNAAQQQPNNRYCDNWYTGEKCKDFMSNVVSTTGGDTFSTNGGEPPQWISGTQPRSTGSVDELKIFNGIIAERGDAQGKEYWSPIALGRTGEGYFSWDFKPVKYTFSCTPWEQPAGGDNCGKCNDNSDKKCTDYRCSSLGAACGILTETINNENPICVDRWDNNPSPPQIIFGDIDTTVYDVAIGNNGASINLANGAGCPEKYTTVEFSLKTDQDAKCYTSTDASGIREGLQNEHNYGKDHLVEVDLVNDANMRIFTICQSPNGVTNQKEYVVDICVSPQPDRRAPLFRGFNPEDGSFLQYGRNNTLLEIKLNEPAECGYSKTAGTNYENMDFFCNTELEGNGPYSCTGGLEGLTNQQNDIFIRCNDSSGNFHTTDKKYTLFQTRENLAVKVNSPTNRSTRETEISPANPLILEVETSKGAYNGEFTECTYKSQNPRFGAGFYENSGKIHRQVFNQNMSNGNYNIEIECKDKAGNVAKTNVHFIIDVDTSPPKVIKKEPRGTDLVLTTDEPAECYYRNDQCGFEIQNATKDITLGRSETHTIEDLNPKLDYYISCIDDLGNYGCSGYVEASEKNDGKGPEIVRIFYDKDETGDLKLITDEDAQCVYKLGVDNCNFEFDEENVIYMTEGAEQGTFGEEHYAEWSPKAKYGIKCKDYWRNGDEEECLAVVKAVEIYQSNL